MIERNNQLSLTRQCQLLDLSQSSYHYRPKPADDSQLALFYGILFREPLHWREAVQGEVVVVPPLKEKIKKQLGKQVALSTIYRMLARNGWRKLAPDTTHPQGDAALREDWKKT